MPEIIAEIGQNFDGDIGRAVEMIKQVKDAGADVAKFQLYDAKALFPKEGNPWYEYNLSTELSRKDIEALAKACDENQVEFMASVFDVERISWLEEVGVKRYKIASRSINEGKLIAALAETKKPIIASLGLWEETKFPEIDADFLYCISKYPTEFSDLKFKDVDFNKYAGFSDHTIGTSAVIAAISRGAQIIEKHYTYDKNAYGPDHSCSMSFEELEQIVNFKNELEQIL